MKTQLKYYLRYCQLFLVKRDRVIAEFLRNILPNFQLLSEQCALNMKNWEWSPLACVAQLFHSILSMRFRNSPERLWLQIPEKYPVELKEMGFSWRNMLIVAENMGQNIQEWTK